MSPGARARTAAPTMQAMDNLKTLAKELNPVVGYPGTGLEGSLRRKRMVRMIRQDIFARRKRSRWRALPCCAEMAGLWFCHPYIF